MDLTRLREWRLRRTMTQRDLAAAAGASKSTVSRLEAGLQRAHPSTAKRLAEALGIRPEDLLAAPDFGRQAFRMPDKGPRAEQPMALATSHATTTWEHDQDRWLAEQADREADLRAQAEEIARDRAREEAEEQARDKAQEAADEAYAQTYQSVFADVFAERFPEIFEEVIHRLTAEEADA